MNFDLVKYPEYKLNFTKSREVHSRNSDYEKNGKTLSNFSMINFSVNNSGGQGLVASTGQVEILAPLRVGTKKKCRQRKRRLRKKCIREDKYELADHLIHYVPIEAGASGSSVFNNKGEVIGVSTYVIKASKTNQAPLYPQSVAVPLSLIHKVLRKNRI